MDHLSLLSHEVAGMSAAIHANDPNQPIDGCPGWTMRELTGHVTGIHRWVLQALENRGAGSYDETPDETDLAEGYDTAANAMLDRLTELPADAPAWTFNRDDQTAGFWRRRQLHELAVHRWDAAPYEISDEVATEGIDEILDFFLPRAITKGLTVLPVATLNLVTPGRTWTLGDTGPETVLEGTPHAVLLTLYQRGSTLPGVWGQTRLTP